jgi:hypothetical protein
MANNVPDWYLRYVVESYINTALWSSTNDDGRPLDSKYEKKDIALGSRMHMERDCREFLSRVYNKISFENAHSIGHDFWLTRNGHGAGFWDGDYPEELGKYLTDVAHSFGECYLLVGDDGMLHLFKG